MATENVLLEEGVLVTEGGTRIPVSAARDNDAYVSILAPSGDSTGITDQANIQRLLIAGATVVLKGGTFYVGGGPAQANGAALSWPSNCKIVLWDATLKLIAAAGIPMLMNANPTPSGTPTDTNLVMVGIGDAVIDGNAANNPHVAGNLTQWKSCTVPLVGVTGWRIERVKIKNPSSWGVSPQNTTGGRFRHIESSCDVSTLNQSPIQVYGKNDDLIIDGITGNSGDDCVALLTYTKQQAGAFVYPSASAYPGGNVTNVTIRNLDGAWGGTGVGNPVRLLCGDGGQITDVKGDNIRSSVVAAKFIQFGPTDYVTTPPAATDCTGIKFTNLHGGAGGAIIQIDQSVQGVQIADVHVVLGWAAIVSAQNKSQTINGLSIDNVHIVFSNGSSATGDFSTIPSGVTVTGYSIRNVHVPNIRWFLKNQAAIVGLDVKGVYLGNVQSSGGVIGSNPAEAGFIDGISARQFGGTVHYAGSAVVARMGPNMPIFTSADVTPSSATKGSIITCDHTKDPTGGAGTTGGQYVASGSAWVKAVDLGSSF